MHSHIKMLFKGTYDSLIESSFSKWNAYIVLLGSFCSFDCTICSLEKGAIYSRQHFIFGAACPSCSYGGAASVFCCQRMKSSVLSSFSCPFMLHMGLWVLVMAPKAPGNHLSLTFLFPNLTSLTKDKLCCMINYYPRKWKRKSNKSRKPTKSCFHFSTCGIM